MIGSGVIILIIRKPPLMKDINSLRPEIKFNKKGGMPAKVNKF